MKIKLIQTGGILPVTREATTQVDWTAEESEAMLKKITLSPGEITAQVRDGMDHILEIDGKEVSVDITKAAGKFAAVLGDLKSNLKIVKT